jgi:hypothetical protein
MRAGLIALALLATACSPAPQEPVEPDLAVCGGPQGVACGAGEYCSFPPTGFCGAAGQTGVCMPRPQACIMEYNPVCGCDVRTYSSACLAAADGTSIAYRTECQP